MALIKQSSVEAVVEASDIVEVVSTRSPLRRVGSRWVGRCPFHEERTPSFSVNPERRLYHCFGCGRGGDLITFVRETEGLDFVQAVEWLAERFRVQLEYEEASPEVERSRRRRERLFSLLEDAARFYERNLWEAKGAAPVQEYLAGRGLGEAVCREYRLGLSPGGDVLARKASAKGYTSDELVAAGLLNRRGNDYFAGRLIFPLADARGRVLGFGARRLSESDPIQAKYVNSPESELFRKRALVYGLDRARSVIAKEDHAIVVEGYTDVLALHQAGLADRRRGNGHVADRAAASRAAPPLLAALPLLRRGRRRHRGDAPRYGSRLPGVRRGAGGRAGAGLPILQNPPTASRAGSRRRSRIRATASGSRSIRLAEQRGCLPAPAGRRRALSTRHHRVGGGDQFAAEPPRPCRATCRRPARSRDPGRRASVSPKGARGRAAWEREALAGCIVHPELVRLLAELSAEHFDSELHRRLRVRLIEGGPPDEDLVALEAELDARAASEGIDVETTKQILLRLHERQLRREIATADPERTKELQTALERIRTAVSELVLGR